MLEFALTDVTVSEFDLACNLFPVVSELAIELFDSAFVDDVERITESAEEVLVVTDHHKTTLEVVESYDQGIDGIEVEMVCWLVKHQNVGLLPSYHGK